MSPTSPAPQPSAPAQTAPTDRRALAALALSVLLPALGTSIANVGLPTLANAFAASFPQVQWVVLSYLLAITTLIVSAGRLGDRLGRARLLRAGILLFTGASLLCSLAPGLPWLVAARAVQGLGAALMMALSMALVGDTVPRARTGQALGLLGSMSAIGTALGPSLGGLLMAGWGWRAIFLVLVLPGLVALALAHRHLGTDRPAPAGAARPFDAAGSLWLVLTLAAYALALGASGAGFGLPRGALLLAALAGLGLLLRVQARAADPLMPLALLGDGRLGGGLALSALVSTVLMATLVVGPFHLTRALGLEAASMGLVVSVGPLVAAFTAAPAGRLVDRLGSQRLALGGLAGIGAGCALLALLPASAGVPGYLGALVLITASYALFQTANNTGVMADLPQQERGRVSGLLNLSRHLGLITGTAAMGAIFTAATGSSDPGAAASLAVAGGTRVTFAVAAVLVASALVVALARAARGKRVSDAAA